MNPAAQREAQATACLEAAERYQAPLVALATGLSGSKEAGMELFQQAVLNCHDAIQSGGFEGDRYEFYLRRAIKNLHYRTGKEQQRWVPFTFQEPALYEDEAPSEWETGPEFTGWERLRRLEAPGLEQEQAALAEQVMQEARQQFGFADRLALRLSLDGLNCRQIAEHIGTKDQSWVWRRLERMKAQLRATFQQAWDGLGE